MEDAASPPPDYRSLEWRDLDKSRFFLYNPAVFLALRVLQHPANVVKTRYQVQQRNSLYASPTGTLIQTLRYEGVRGLYRGFSTSTLMLVVQQAYIMMYEYLRSAERYSVPLSESTRNALAAGVSVLLVQVPANPVDVVTQRLFLQGQLLSNAPMQAPAPPSSTAAVGPLAAGAAASPPSAGTPSSTGVPRVLTAREVAVSVLREHGLLRGFYSGFLISCAQFIPSSSLWWWSYPLYRDHLRSMLAAPPAPDSRDSRDAGATSPAAAGVSVRSWLASVIPAARLAEVLGGACSSATVAVAVNPIDIVRTRAQVEGKPALAVFRELLAVEGARGLLKGATARMAMLTPQGALTVTAYELVKRMSMIEDAAAARRTAMQ